MRNAVAEFEAAMGAAGLKVPPAGVKAKSPKTSILDPNKPRTAVATHGRGHNSRTRKKNMKDIKSDEMAEPPAEPIFSAYDFHELALLFPLMEGPAFDELVADIKANGLQQAITLLDGRILDGRNRFRACEAAGIEPKFKTYEGGDPLRFIVSANLHRRHLDTGQRAMIAARLANLHDGQRADYAAASQICKPVTQAQAAELMNVSPRSVAHAKTVQEHGSPELQKAVDAGEISPSRAAFEITETQKRIADRYVTKSGKLKTSDERRAEELEAKSETVSDLDSDEMSTLIARESELSAAAQAAAPRCISLRKSSSMSPAAAWRRLGRPSRARLTAMSRRL